MHFLILITLLIFMQGCFDFQFQKDKQTKTTETKITYTPEQLELKTHLDHYFQNLQALNTDTIMEMTYPKLFSLINKTLFKQYLNTLLNSEHISIESFDTNITDMSNVQAFSNGKYAQISYLNTIKLNLVNPKLYSDDLSVRILNDVLSRKYGQENIEIDAAKRSIIIRKEEKLLAIKDLGKEWKFLGDNESYRELYPNILLPDLLSEI